MARTPVVVLQDPYRDYSERLMRIYAQRYGLRTVALYLDENGLRKHRRQHPELDGPLVQASYAADRESLDRVVEALAERYDVRAVVPVFETDVDSLGRLAELLDLSWAQPGVIDRFRDKGALKEHLRSVPDGPRINRTRVVAGADDVLAAIHDEAWGRVVCKPNDGWGNQRIAFFGPETPADDVRTYFERVAGTRILMEEYLGGTELFVNGQIDENGEPHVISVVEPFRVAANGLASVAAGGLNVRTHRPEFALCADYARAVMRASGLRRSPFHLELKLDDDGPCLLEVGARFAGANICTRDAEAHGGLDLFGIAAHHFLTDEPYGDYGLNWAEYDRLVRGTVSGIVDVDARVHTVEGRREVEAMPGFVRWELAPDFGNHVVPTIDLVGQPWRITMTAPDEDAYRAQAQVVRETIRINPRGSSGVRRVKELTAYAPPVARELLSRLPGGPSLERLG